MQPRFVVLIDAENVPSKHWPRIRDQLESTGTIIACRIFGDFSNGRLGKWIKRHHMLHQGPGADRLDINPLVLVELRFGHDSGFPTRLPEKPSSALLSPG